MYMLMLIGGLEPVDWDAQLGHRAPPAILQTSLDLPFSFLFPLKAPNNSAHA